MHAMRLEHSRTTFLLFWCQATAWNSRQLLWLYSQQHQTTRELVRRFGWGSNLHHRETNTWQGSHKAVLNLSGLCTEEIQTPIQSLHDLAGLIGRSVYQSLWQCFCLSLQWSIVLLALWMLAVSAMRLNPDLWQVKCSNEHSSTFNLMNQLTKDQFIQNCGSIVVPICSCGTRCQISQPKDAASTTSASL